MATLVIASHALETTLLLNIGSAVDTPMVIVSVYRAMPIKCRRLLEKHRVGLLCRHNAFACFAAVPAPQQQALSWTALT